jgi:hypothetical protein
MTIAPITGTAGNDTLRGTAQDDVVFGLGGADNLRGLGGNDILEGGLGNDVIEGGAGVDIVSFADVGGGVTLDLSAPGPNGFAAARIDRDGNGSIDETDRIRVSEIDESGTEGAKGGDGNDVFTGNGRANTFIGSGGNDRYLGKGGSDTLDYTGTGLAVEIAQGGLYTKRDGATVVGVDTVGAFDVVAGTIEVFETVIGEAGLRNRLNGAGAFASVVIDLGAGRIDATVEQALGGFPAGASFGFDVVNFVDAAGSDFDDTITGSADDNVIAGSAGSDVLRGGDGSDTLDYTGTGLAVEIAQGGLYTKRDAGGAVVGTDTVGAFDLFAPSIEVFETVIGEAGLRNKLNGAGAFASVAIDLGAGRIDATVEQALGGFPAGASFGFDVVNFVDAAGSDFDDTITGSADDNVITGSLGSDTLRGGDGADTLDYTGTGLAVEIAQGGLYTKRDAGGTVVGVDTVGAFDLFAPSIEVFETVIGEAGLRNRLNGAGAFASVAIDLGAGRIDATVEQALGGFPAGASFGFDVVNFVDAAGSDFDDTITGSADDNVIAGSAGSDVLRGGGGADTLDYTGTGLAVEIAQGGLYTKRDAGGAVVGTDTVGAFDVVAGTIEVFETVIGEAGLRNKLNGAGSGVKVDIDLGAGRIDATVTAAAFGGFVAGDSFGFDVLNFVDASGSDENDTIVGSELSNILSGGLGLDTIDGGDGADDIQGGGGNDQLDGGDGADFVRGDGGNDTLLGGAGDDDLRGGAGADRLEGGVGADRFRGGAGNDTFVFTFDALVDRVFDFGTGSDTLVLGSGFGSFENLAFVSLFDANFVATAGADTFSVVVQADGDNVFFLNGTRFALVDDIAVV